MGLLGQALTNTAASTAGTMLGQLAGRIGVNYDMRKQQQQQQALQNIQLQGEKNLFDYQQAGQLDFWHKTSYGAQLEEMKKAGLSPALMYGGGSGGSGTTAGGIPSLGSASASSPNTAMKGDAGMGLMNAAQIGLIQAQTKNIEADTANKPKVGANIEADTASITQGITNMKAQKALTDAQTRIQNIQGNVAEESQDDAIQRIHSETFKAIQDAHMAMKEAGISDATQEAKITQLKAQAIGAILQNDLTKAQTNKATTAAEVDKEQITKMAQDVAQGWEGLSIRMKEAKMKAVIEEYNAQFQGNVSKWLPANAQSMARQIDEIMGISQKDFKNNKHK